MFDCLNNGLTVYLFVRPDRAEKGGREKEREIWGKERVQGSQWSVKMWADIQNEVVVIDWCADRKAAMI